MKDKNNSPFFVGYLNMPDALKRFYLPLTVLLVGFSGLVGYGLASLQKSSGPGVWQVAETETISGYLTVDPYPVVHRIDPNDPTQIQSVLLVGQGKHSAARITSPFQQKMVSVTGVPIRRGGWTMLELGAEQSIEPQQNQEGSAEFDRLAQAAAGTSLGPVTMTGELADSKCFLGVMKPGSGKVHKACAEVCLIGGLPAMLVVKDKDNTKYGYILTQNDNSAASRAVADQAAESVEVSGELLQKGNLFYIRMSG